jgi:nicotinate dehydrogenase subunit A
MGAKALLDKNPHPSISDIKRSLNSYICRCGTHLRVIRAIRRVSNASVKA